jgi:hypothetical protein
MSKITDSSVDAVSLVQVVREVSNEFLYFIFDEIKRILKKGGVLYIRDNDHDYQENCMHSLKNF